jgi:hypothetical protein
VEFGGSHDRAIARGDAAKRLEPHDLARPEINNRLIVGFDAAVLKRFTEKSDRSQTPRDGRPQARFVKRKAPASHVLGVIQREIGVAFHALDVGVVVRHDRTAHRGTADDGMAEVIHGELQGVENLPRHRDQACSSGLQRHEDGKFVAADAKRPLFWNDRCDGFRGAGKKAVAAWVAEGIVDLLEIVEVD